MMVLAFAAFGLVAMIDWWSVATRRHRVEEWAKPATLILLIVAAIFTPAQPVEAMVALVVGLVCGLAGDIFLLPRIDRFLSGLISFFLGHLAYLVALVLVMVDEGPAGRTGRLALAGVATIVLLTMARLPSLFGAVAGGGSSNGDGHRSLLGPVVAYAIVIMAMAATAVATGRILQAAGAIAFVASDRLLAEDRFVRPLPAYRWIVHLLYHLGQAGLVLGLQG